MKSCKILRYGAVCGLAALAAVGCSVDDAETIRVRGLTAAEHELFVPASGGTAEIQLYSNGRVRVEALNDIGGWASVDRTEFDGDRMVSVTFTENGSFRRMAKLRFVLDGGTRADTVCIKQYGVVPSLECPAPYKSIRGSVETFTQFEIDTKDYVFGFKKTIRKRTKNLAKAIQLQVKLANDCGRFLSDTVRIVAERIYRNGEL